MTQTLLDPVESTIQKYQMLARGERVLVACSGGTDSVALFHLLRGLIPRLSLRLSLIHFDHALRAGSEKDFKFVQAMARQFGIPFYGARRKSVKSHFGKNLSPEELARKRRYDFFREVAKKTRIRKIALGHQRDDQAETVLMRLLQGTGLRGLQGIRPVVKADGIILVRPLLSLSRAQIREFLRKHSIPYREDPTNRSGQFLRNRIRSRLLPLLERKFNPRIRESLSRLAETATAELQGLDDWVKQNWKSYVRARRNGTIWFDRERFLSLPAVLEFRLLDEVLHVLDPRSGLDFESWRRIEEQLPERRLRITLPRNIELVLNRTHFVCRRGTKNDTMRRKLVRK